MLVNVIMGPAEMGDIGQATVAVIDILRATTSMVVALACGCREIFPVATPSQALSMSGPGVVLAGEREGRRIPGFHLGNSPVEFTARTVAGRQVVMTTSNGTRALLAAAEAGRITVASFLNAGAVAAVLAGQEKVILLCSGRAGGFSLEDWVAAGLLVEEMARLAPGLEYDDAARAARAAYGQFNGDLLGMLCSSEHGRWLAAQGYAGDLALAARRDTHPVVPVYSGGMLRL